MGYRLLHGFTATRTLDNKKPRDLDRLLVHPRHLRLACVLPNSVFAIPRTGWWADLARAPAGGAPNAAARRTRRRAVLTNVIKPSFMSTCWSTIFEVRFLNGATMAPVSGVNAIVRPAGAFVNPRRYALCMQAAHLEGGPLAHSLARDYGVGSKSKTHETPPTVTSRSSTYPTKFAQTPPLPASIRKLPIVSSTMILAFGNDAR